LNAQSILRVSCDENLQNSRALVLDRAGYIQSERKIESAQFAWRGVASWRSLVICSTQRNRPIFIARVHESNLSVFIFCLRHALTPRNASESGCWLLLRATAGSGLCILDPDNVVAWPKKSGFLRAITRFPTANFLALPVDRTAAVQALC
jgi:hypothetical protein